MELEKAQKIVAEVVKGLLVLVKMAAGWVSRHV